jgi:hypothetical protein
MYLPSAARCPLKVGLVIKVALILAADILKIRMLARFYILHTFANLTLQNSVMYMVGEMILVEICSSNLEDLYYLLQTYLVCLLYSSVVL